MIIEKLSAADDSQNRDPTSGFWYGPVGRLTASGVAVSEQVAMTLSACWACTRALAAPAGYLPLNVMRKLDGGGSELVSDHPLQRLLHDAPNEEMGATIWRSMGVAQQVNAGNTYAEIERTNAGDVLALWPIHPSRVEPKRDESGALYYRVRDGATTTDVPPEDMLHVPSMISDDGITGKGVIRHARETIGHAIATETYGAGWFKSGGRLSSVLKHPKRMDKEARENLRKEWKALYGGADGDRVGILWEGMTYESIASDPEDSQFIASRQHNIEEICRWYGVPPHMVQHLLRATFNNIEELGLEFVRYSLLPWLKLWEQEIWRKLFTPAEQRTYFVKHNVDALERGDVSKRTAALAQQFFNGALTLNQWMELEDRNPIGPDGDVHFVQQAMTPLSRLINPPEPQPAPQEGLPQEPPPDQPPQNAALVALREEFERRAQEREREQMKAAHGVIQQVLTRFMAREANEAARAARKPNVFLAWIDTFYAANIPALEAELLAPVRMWKAAGGCFGIDVASRKCRDIAARHAATSRSDLLRAAECQPDELPATVEAVTSQWKESREPEI